MQKELEFAVETSKEAGKILLQYFGRELTKKIKSHPEDFATEADEEAEKIILKRLSQSYPDDTIITEESGFHGKEGAEYTWIVDPLDGTKNFSSGSKDYAVMISRAKGEKIILAVIWSPATKTLATAKFGEGALLNNKLIRLDDSELDDKPLSVEKNDQEQLKEVGYSVTNLGASPNTIISLMGERRGFVSSNGYIWDFAPPALLLSEAGWKVTDIKGNPFRWIGKVEHKRPGVIASSINLHAKLLKALNGPDNSSNEHI